MTHLRIFSTAFAMAICMPSLLAQQANTFSHPFIKKRGVVTEPHGNIQAKSTATGSRLIAEVDLEDNAGLLPTDSVVYFYSGTRGGDLDYTLKFDSLIAYQVIGTNTYINEYSGIQTFDANNNIIAQRSWQWNTATSAWDNVDLISLVYDVNNNLLKTTRQLWDNATSSWQNSYRDSSVYDANNNVISYTSQDWNNVAGNWFNTEQDFYTYMPNNKVATTFLNVWDAALSQWDSLAYFVNLQDGNGNIIRTIIQNYDTANNLWINSQEDSFVYDGINRLISDWKFSWNTMASVWFKTGRITYSSFTGQSPQTETDEYWTDVDQAFHNTELILNTYNPYEQLTSFSGADWDSIAWAAPHYGARYYYQPYTLTVTPLTGSNGNATIYPVPAKNEITISVNWNETQGGTINIVDVQGRNIKSLSMAPSLSFKTTIPVNDLPPGNYLIKINGTKGDIVQRLTIAP